MKKVLALFLAVAILTMSIPGMALVGFAAKPELTQAEKNTRDTVPPVTTGVNGTDKVYSLNHLRNSDIIYFPDETLVTDATSSDYINRVSFSDYVNSFYRLGAMFLPNVGDPGNFKADASHFASGDVWYQYDFGIKTTLTGVNIWPFRTNYPYNINSVNSMTPKQVRILWSQDGEQWSSKDFYCDYTSEDNPFHEQYLALAADSSLSVSDFVSATKPTYDIELNNGDAVIARYVRIAPIVPTQTFTDGTTGEITLTINGLEFVDNSEAIWTGEGAGTEASPYLINSVGEFKNFVAMHSSKPFAAGTYFKLTTDLDLADVEWTPGNAFYGILDGDNHTIKNMTMGSLENRATSLYAGIFAYNYGTIKNLHMDNSVMFTQLAGNDGGRTSAIVGYNQSGGVIENCYVTNAFLSHNTTGVGGGIAATNKGLVNNCYVTDTHIDTSRPGGIVGDNDATVTNCFTYGIIYMGNDDVNWPNTLTGLAKGAVVANGKNSSNCYYYNEIGLTDPKGAVAKTADEFKSADLVATLNGEGSVWTAGTDYPVLASFANTQELDISANVEAALENITADSYALVANEAFASLYLNGEAISADAQVTYIVDGTSITANIWKVEDGKTYIYAPYVVYNASSCGDMVVNGKLVKVADEVDFTIGEVLSNGATSFTVEDNQVTAHIGKDASIHFVVGGDYTGKYLYNTIWGGDGVASNVITTMTELDGKKGFTFAPDEEDTDYTIAFAVPGADVVEYDIISFPWAGTGAEADPYIIRNIYGFEFISEWYADNDGFNGKYFKLAGDIDFTGVSWTPIATFKGTLDGDGYTIANLTLGTSHDNRANLAKSGLIDDNQGTIKNTHFDNITIYTHSSNNDSRMGGIAAVNNGTIDNCYLTNSHLSFISTGVGGGICGDNRGTINNCYVTTTHVDNSRPGGIVGDNYGPVTNSFTYGMTYLGYGNYNGSTNPTKTGYIGSIVGQQQSGGSTSNCYYYNEISIADNGGATAKTADEFTALTATLNGESGTAWVQGADYPELAIFVKAVIEADITNVVFAEGIYTVTYSAVTNSDDATVIIALYTGDVMTGVKYVNAAETSTVITAAAGANKASIFVFENMGSIKPLCVNDIYPIQ